MTIRIGCSFLCRNKDELDQYTNYVYAAPALAPFKASVGSTEEVNKFIDSFKNFSVHDLLHKSFEEDDNPFKGSAVVPYKAVCLYIWISK